MKSKVSCITKVVDENHVLYTTEFSVGNNIYIKLGPGNYVKIAPDIKNNPKPWVDHSPDDLFVPWYGTLTLTEE